MRRTLVLALVLAVVSLGVGILVALQAFPSDDDIERVTIEEVARDNPLLGQILQSPIIDESRSALYLGAGAYGAVLVVGVGLIAADHRRRHVGEPTPAGQVAPPS
jgi:hypothetical protein